MKSQTFGGWLAQQRRNLSLSQRQFAERANIQSALELNDIEQDRVNPGPYVQRISAVLSIGVDEVSALANNFEMDSATRKERRKSVEAGMLAFRMERGS